MALPFIDLRRFEAGFMEEWLEKAKAISQAARFVGGSEIEAFEARLLKDCQTSYAVACANGTDALQIALRAAGIGRGDKVILPNLTFWATFEAIINVGADPLVVDINPEDMQMDFDSFRQAIEDYRPQAAVIAHLYGWGSARLGDFRQYAAERDIRLIEDGAQAYGVRYNKNSIYQSAEIATISFYPSKVFGAAGDGGAVVTSNRRYAEQARQLANHGRSDSYAHALSGWNSRMDALQAAYLNVGGAYLPERLCSRRQSADHYRRAFENLNRRAVECLSAPSGFEENGYLNLLLLEPEQREGLIKALQQEQIGFGIIYPLSILEQAGVGSYIKGQVIHGKAEQIARRVLSLPLFPYMQTEELDQVVGVVKKALGK